MRESIHDKARGRWRSMLPMLGVPAAYLTNKHGPCPICGGKDRFRWDDKAGDGSYFCNGCGAGTGVDLVMKVNKCGFKDAVALVEDRLGVAQIEVKAQRSGNDALLRVIDGLWRSGVPLDGSCVASVYLRRRGIELPVYPSQIRFSARTTYVHTDGRKTQHPAMLAQFVSADASARTLHVTYLDSNGNKAAGLDPVRKLARGKVPLGGSVRLAPSAETMGVAEGIETAMSASLMFGVPVWAALNAGLLTKWEPPASARCVIVFADCDGNFTGQAAAYALAHRLKSEGRQVEVRIPDLIDTDWNDMHVASKE